MNPVAGEFCWVDLAATDAGAARVFYERLFGWKPVEQAAGGGVFTRLQLDGHDVGSLYQLRSLHLEQGMRSHWTPYVRVSDVEAAARKAVACGGKIVIQPLAIGRIARIALIMDPVGAIVGLWES
jgi:predicted enzyme related to lactoylglutathione lyase